MRRLSSSSQTWCEVLCCGIVAAALLVLGTPPARGALRPALSGRPTIGKHASTCTPSAAGKGKGWGSTLLSGSAWLGGNGVDVISNGSTIGYVSGCDSGYGLEWQCVELPQRLYAIRGWYSRTHFPVDYADQIYTSNFAGLVRHANKTDTYVPVPGDMIVYENGFTGGHVSVVDSVNVATGVINLVEEDSNPSAGGRATMSISVAGNGTVTLARSNWTVYGTVHSPANTNTNNGSYTDGTFLRTETGNVYVVAGGAPLYINSLNGFGSPTFTSTTQAAVNAMPAYPSDGTFISDVADGRVYEVVGGAPEYVSAGDANRVPGWGSRPVTTVAHYDLVYFDHLRPFPVDGTYVANVDDGRVYRVAGGAPEYVSASDAAQLPGWGTQTITTISGYEFAQYDHLRQYPADGTYVANVADGRVYRVAGGAPEYVTAAHAASLPGWGQAPIVVLSSYEFGAYEHLRQYPADGTFIVGDRDVYVVAGGAPIYVSNWAAVGGEQVPVRIDQTAIDEAGGGTPWNHLRLYPADGTLLRVLSGATYNVQSGVAGPDTVGNLSFTTLVDQAAIDNAGGTGVWSHLKAAPPPPTYLAAADINGDGAINIVDLSILLTNYGGPGPRGDINADGTVDILDLSILLTHYGTTR